jgi:uncharacterized protein (DUF58 family)
VKNFIKSIYLNNRFFLYIILNVLIFVLGHFYDIFYTIGRIAFISFIVLIIIDFLLLYNTSSRIILAKRVAPEKLSNGDLNIIKIYITNNYSFPVNIKIIDEIPHQFQVRDFLLENTFKPSQEKIFEYTLKPTKRGEYSFGNLNIYCSTLINFISRRFKFDNNKIVPVYPSYIQMKKYELMAISNRLIDAGIKKIRRISNNKEFEEIREYVFGDDYRTINWNATARRNNLMVNQYQDEKSQQVMSLIDMGRTMKMPFEGMSLLDYAINTSLVISNIAILKQDKAGLLTFSKNIHSIVPPSRRNNQMTNINEVLYNQSTNYSEANYELLYTTIKHKLNQRSLLLLYTNFETLTALNRHIKFFRQLAKSHLLVVIFFENTEIKNVLNTIPKTTEEIYIKTIAEKFIYEKKLIVKELKKYGIHSFLTEPKNLTINTINKYLELKAMGLI